MSVQIEKQTEKFNLYIPDAVLKKIEYLCAKIPHKEWSGVLYFKTEGNLRDIKNFKVRCVDLYPMDIGTAGATEYEFTPEWANYTATHPELMEEGVYMGHIHSHNTMATFFSGTDQQELADSTQCRNNFVSLIVNNAGTYTAAVATKVKRTFKGTTGVYYVDFQNNPYELENTEDRVVESVVWYEANIIKESSAVNKEFMQVVDSLIEKDNSKTVVWKYPETPKRTIIVPQYKSDAPASSNVSNKSTIDQDARILLARLVTGSLYSMCSLDKAFASIPKDLTEEQFITNVSNIADFIEENTIGESSEEYCLKVYQRAIQILENTGDLYAPFSYALKKHLKEYIELLIPDEPSSNQLRLNL